MNKLFLILVFGLNLHAVTAFSNGGVTLACMSMTPNHRNNTASMLEPPYSVTTDVSNYTQGQVITVTLQANETAFKGFLLQARDETGPVGTFTVMGSDAQLLNCGTEGSAVSHRSNVNKSTIVAQWKAPNTNNADISFRATFVQSFSLFWVGVQSDPVRFVGTNTTVPPPQTTTHNSSPPQMTTHNSSPPQMTTHNSSPPQMTTYNSSPPQMTTHNSSPPQMTTYNSSPSVSLAIYLLLLPLLASGNYIKTG
ncbi:putative defense protein [Onychostoma macrolepis]|uniref:Reelin domain-containing protein n=1 Tax=Onychostoma macrolepis TaxID=369639 RepID=A0A7J6DCV2_9TELE|nr:putative defense protein [Onychostoma macrolepis]KAF4117123.1 hypothetical protein G5714_001676 [Onychostoma macrolepis]